MMTRYELHCKRCDKVLGYMTYMGCGKDTEVLNSTQVCGEYSEILCPACEVKRLRENTEETNFKDYLAKQMKDPKFREEYLKLSEDENYTSISTGYAQFMAEDMRTCDNCKHNAGLPSHNGTMEYSGVCKKCVAKDMWEAKKND